MKSYLSGRWGNFNDDDQVADDLVVSKIIVNYRGLQKEKYKSRTLSLKIPSLLSFKFLVHFKEICQKL